MSAAKQVSNKKTVLVTGAAGYIGSHMSKVLVENGFEVIGIDNFSNSFKGPPNHASRLIEADISDKKILSEIFQNHQIHAVFHFASSIEVGESMSNCNLYYRNNLANSINLLDQIITHSKNSFFIFSSTAAIYQSSNENIRETDPKIPASVYGKSKLFAEEILQDYAKIHGLKYGALRYFNACGADDKNNLGENRKTETHLIPLLLKKLNGGADEFFIFGNDYSTADGTCIRDYIHVVDLCQAHLQMLQYLENGGEENCFNVGTSSGFSVLEIIEAAMKITGKKLQINFKPRRAGDCAYLVASNEKIISKLGWKPRFSSLENIILSAWNFEKNLKK
jgi:UDP-glucose 4-epimerase